MSGQILGPYKIIEPIDSGGMAHVYRAEDRQGRFGIIALKVMREEIASGREYQLRFRREAKIWAELDHPNIVPLLDYSNNNGQPYVAMRYIDGCSLHDFLSERGYLPLNVAIPIMQDVLAAVEYAHKKKVIHRDIKPDNVLLDQERRAYLTDFGIAKPVGATALTNTGARLGTPTYMAPEQIRGKKNISARADIYALGVMFYELLTGRPPFQSDDPMVLSHAHCYEEPPPLKRRGTPFPVDLQNLIARCLEKDLKKRPRSVSSMIKVLNKVAKVRKKKSNDTTDPDFSVKSTALKLVKSKKKKLKVTLPPEISYHSSIVNSQPSLPVGAIARVGGFIIAAGLLLGLATTDHLGKKISSTYNSLKKHIEGFSNQGARETAAKILKKESTRSALMMFEYMVNDNPRCASFLVEPIVRSIEEAIDKGYKRRARLLSEYCIRLEPAKAVHRLRLTEILFRGNLNIEAGRQYVRALEKIPNSGLLEHLEKSSKIYKKLHQREKRIVASRYYLAAKGLLVAGRADLANPYARAAYKMEPWNRLYKRIYKPPPPVTSRRLR